MARKTAQKGKTKTVKRTARAAKKTAAAKPVKKAVRKATVRKVTGKTAPARATKKAVAAKTPKKKVAARGSKKSVTAKGAGKTVKAKAPPKKVATKAPAAKRPATRGKKAAAPTAVKRKTAPAASRKPAVKVKAAAAPVKAPPKKAAKPGVKVAAPPVKAAPAPAAPVKPAAPPKPAPPPKPAVDVEKYLADLDRLGMKPGLTRVQKLLHALGNPEKKLKVIHIVGTNGKSSTARMLSAILGAHGIKAGAYLSPHLVSFTERFLINGKEISDQRFEKLILDVRKVAEDVNKRSRSSGPLTQFEILTAAAYLYFHQQKVGTAVVEAGLGGRFDATSVVDSKVQVLTNVELEHTELLGETVAEIVREKAAVIPDKGNVVLGGLSREALAEAMKICRRKKAKVLSLGEEFSLIKGPGDKFDVWTARGQYADLALTLFGQYQRTNCAVAIQAAELFMRKPLDEKKLRRALPRITIPARLEVISEKPMIILDGAHNPSGIDELLNSLQQMMPARRTICVVSILKDKDAERMLGRLLDFCDILFITENSNPRCASAQELSRLPVVKNSTVQTFVARENQSALESAFKLASIRDVILVTGSLYLLADIKKRMV